MFVSMTGTIPPAARARPSQRIAGQFYGQAVASQRAGGLVLTDCLHDPRSRLPRHEHERAYLSFIRGGSFTETYGRRSRFCVPGMLLLHPPGEAHAEQMNCEPVSSLNIELSSHWLTELLEVGSPLDRPSHLQNETIAQSGFELFRELNRPDRDSTLSIETLAREILFVALPRKGLGLESSKPPWLQNVRDLVDGSLDRPPVFRQIAKEVGVHHVHFAVMFRRFHGCSLGEYYRRRRLDAARARLADLDSSLALVALELGFADQSHFTRTFKRYTGMTPGRYRTFLAFKTG